MFDALMARVFGIRPCVMNVAEDSLRTGLAARDESLARIAAIAADSDWPEAAQVAREIVFKKHCQFVADVLAELKPSPEERKRLQDAGLL